MSQVTVDISGAIKKTAALFKLPAAAKKQVTDWSTESVLVLKRAASNLKKTDHKSGDLARGVGMSVEIGSSGYNITIGTGVGGTKSVKYARIQDEGGTITAKGKYLTIPFPGVSGTANNYRGNSFVFRSKAGNLIIAERKGKNGLRPLFTLKHQVNIPATQWFTYNMEQRVPMLNEAMSEEAVFKRAQELSGV
jgi:hypothetical protein